MRDSPVAELGRWLKRLREAAGLSHDQLAAALENEKTRQQLIAYEQGRNEPKATTFLRVLDALGQRVAPVAPPESAPRALNAEVAELRRAVDALSREQERHHREVASKLEGHEQTLRQISAAISRGSRV